jgi:hypothetical protein
MATQARLHVQAARAPWNAWHWRPPQVVYYAAGAPWAPCVAARLREQGALVAGPGPLGDSVLASVPPAPAAANLDITTLCALVSELSHGAARAAGAGAQAALSPGFQARARTCARPRVRAPAEIVTPAAAEADGPVQHDVRGQAFSFGAFCGPVSGACRPMRAHGAHGLRLGPPSCPPLGTPHAEVACPARRGRRRRSARRRCCPACAQRWRAWSWWPRPRRCRASRP